jgi:hypothetical protein
MRNTNVLLVKMGYSSDKVIFPPMVKVAFHRTLVVFVPDLHPCVIIIDKILNFN